MSTFVQKSEATQQTVSAKAPVPGWANFGQSPEVNWILHLQRTIGNQAVQRLLEANARDVNGNSTPEIARFGHDLSRMPAHAATPVEVQLRPSLRKGDEEPNLAPVTQKVTVPAPSQIAPTEPALMQRRPAEAIDKSPRMMQPRALMDGIDNSARVLQQKTFAGSISSSPLNVEQHEQRESFFGGAVQRKREEELKGKFAQRAKGREEEEEPLQCKAPPEPPAQLQELAPKFNGTGLPDQLKSAIESLSGMSLDDVNVHYNSARPAQLNALAYARGSDIHVAPGQEQHLPHEAWHVVQQAQGRVQPTMQLQDGVPVNDDDGLEQEATVMGAKALAPAAQAQDGRQEEEVQQMGPGEACRRRADGEGPLQGKADAPAGLANVLLGAQWGQAPQPMVRGSSSVIQLYGLAEKLVIDEEADELEGDGDFVWLSGAEPEIRQSKKLSHVHLFEVSRDKIRGQLTIRKDHENEKGGPVFDSEAVSEEDIRAFVLDKYGTDEAGRDGRDALIGGLTELMEKVISRWNDIKDNLEPGEEAKKGVKGGKKKKNQ